MCKGNEHNGKSSFDNGDSSMNKQKLISLCHKISDEKHLPFNTVLMYCFMEKILTKFSKSQFRDKFIFKGGFLLSNILGLETRTTMDIDFLLRNFQLCEENLSQIFKEALKTDENENVHYALQKIEPIKENSDYSGFRVDILCSLENIKENVQLDIATGDVITPFPIDYKYKSVFGNEEIKIVAYPLETIIAEKLQIIYYLGFANSRSKDYYDLYILYKLKIHEVRKSTLLSACEKTFSYRQTEFSIDKIENLLSNLQNDKTFKVRWNSYTKKNSYTKGIQFEDVISGIQELLIWMKT